MKIVNIIKKLNKTKTILIFIAIAILILVIFIPNGILNTIINAIQKETEYSIDYSIKKYNETTGLYHVLLTITYPDGIEEVNNETINQNTKFYGRKKIAIDYNVTENTEYSYNIKLSDGTNKKEKILFKRKRIGIGTYIKNQQTDVYVNKPDLTGYYKEYTRYLVYDENNILKPGKWIKDEEPFNWYNYKENLWANIHVESEGVESYYVWIPRYCYKVKDSTAGNQRMDIKFIDVFNNYIDPETDEEISWEELKNDGYQIPRAFEFGDYGEIPLSGYWMSKYELSDLTQYSIEYNLTASESTFYITLLKANIPSEIDHWTVALNGKIVDTSNEIKDFNIQNENSNEDNYINITALDSEGRIVGSLTKKMEVIEVNPPDLSGFDRETTYYAYWDEDGTEHNDIPISEEPPERWYNYSYKRWANVVTRGVDSNGNETLSYFVWIPRYQYRLNTTNQRTSVRFINGLGTEVDDGYSIPSAFTWNMENEAKELYGYWISKYELN